MAGFDIAVIATRRERPGKVDLEPIPGDARVLAIPLPSPATGHRQLIPVGVVICGIRPGGVVAGLEFPVARQAQRFVESLDHERPSVCVCAAQHCEGESESAKGSPVAGPE